MTGLALTSVALITFVVHRGQASLISEQANIRYAEPALYAADHASSSSHAPVLRYTHLRYILWQTAKGVRHK